MSLHCQAKAFDRKSDRTAVLAAAAATRGQTALHLAILHGKVDEVSWEGEALHPEKEAAPCRAAPRRIALGIEPPWPAPAITDLVTNGKT